MLASFPFISIKGQSVHLLLLFLHLYSLLKSHIRPIRRTINLLAYKQILDGQNLENTPSKGYHSLPTMTLALFQQFISLFKSQ
jgi:hypothetical protein